MYGDKVRTEYMQKTGRQVDVIGEVATAPAGNLVIRVGRLLPGMMLHGVLHERGWERTGHIVLTPAEADAFVAEVQANMAGIEVGTLLPSPSDPEWRSER